MSDDPRPVTGMHFPQPVVVVDLGRYEAMTRRIEELERELKGARDHIDRLGYRFVGARVDLQIVQGAPLRPGGDVVVRVPEIRIRAADTVEPYHIKPRSIDEAVQTLMRRREVAIECAMRHAAETWVRHFHELAARMTSQ